MRLSSAEVVVGGQRYHQFVSLTVERSKENLTASGTFILSWPGAEQFNATSPPAQEVVDGATIEVYLDGQKVCTGRIDSRTSQGSPNNYTLSLAFRGKAAAIVDSTADHESGQENKKTPADIIKKLMEGYESQLVDRSNESRQLERFVIAEGETVERSIRRAAREYGLLITEDENGDLVLNSRESQQQYGSPLILGQDFTDWSATRDIGPRYSKVTVKGDSIATDERYGKDAEVIAAEVIDQYVQFKKELRLFAEEDQDAESLKARAQMEANRRAGKGTSVTMTMSSWSDKWSGQLWTPGTIHHVSIPVDQIDDDLQIQSVSFELDSTNATAKITLVMPETFQSQGNRSGIRSGGSIDKGKAAVRTSGGGGKSVYDVAITNPIVRNS